MALSNDDSNPLGGCTHRSRLRRRLRSAWLVLGALLLAVHCGCQSGPVISARRLPPEFAAPFASSPQRVDLSRIAAATSNNQILYPGDVLEVAVVTGVETTKPESVKLRVADDGSITVPLVGPVAVAGSSVTQAEQAVRAASVQRGIYVNPNVTVVLFARKTNSITVAGAVEKPGVYEVPASSSDVLTAISMAEGLSKEAGTVLEIRHPPGYALANADPRTGLASYPGEQRLVPVPPRSIRVNLEDPHLQGGRSDLLLQDGATVMVMPKLKRFVHVIGLVNQAGQFEMPDDQDLYLLQAISLAGNRRLEIADKVHIIRQVPGRTEPVVIEASLKAAKRDAMSNLRLAPGDVVSVEETPTTMVVGTIREFVRFGFSSALPMF